MSYEDYNSEDKITEPLKRILDTFSEEHGLDSMQVLWSRTEGELTHSGHVGVGNVFARAYLCNKFVNMQLHDDEHSFDQDFDDSP